MAAGTWRGEPFTKMVRCAWMWKMVCSLLWQLIPSMSLPVAAVAVLASGAALGIGKASGPAGGETEFMTAVRHPPHERQGGKLADSAPEAVPGSPAWHGRTRCLFPARRTASDLRRIGYGG